MGGMFSESLVSANDWSVCNYKGYAPLNGECFGKLSMNLEWTGEKFT